MSDPSLEQRLLAVEQRADALEAALARQADVDPTAPLWMQNVAYPAADMRRLISALWPQGGVIWGLQVVPRQDGPNLSVDVLPGQAAIVGNDTPDQGAYLWTLPARTNYPLQAVPGVGLQRLDTVAIPLRDDAVVGELAPGQERGGIVVLPGTPSGSPQPAALPPTSQRLAQLGPITPTTAQITDGLITGQALPPVGGPVLLDSIQVLSPTPSVVFTNIPQNYSSLTVIGAAASSTPQDLRLYFDGVTAPQYSGQQIIYNGSVATGGSYNANSRIAWGPHLGASATALGHFEMLLPEYSRSNIEKALVITGMVTRSWGAGQLAALRAGATASQLPITSIHMDVASGNIIPPSHFSLYGNP